MPVSGTERAEVSESSQMSKEAERTPAAVGLKVTLIVQVAPSKNNCGQFWVTAKSLPFAPESLIAPMSTGKGPTFLTVTCWAAPGVPITSGAKVRDVGVREI